MEKRVKQMNLWSTPTSTPNATALKKLIPGSSNSDQQRDSVPSTSANSTLNPLKSSEFFPSVGAPPSHPSGVAGNDTQLRMAGFISQTSWNLITCINNHSPTSKTLQNTDVIRHLTDNPNQ